MGKRTRIITQYPKNFGQACEESLGQVTSCNRAPCESGCTPQDCLMGDWGEWGACDKCGGQMKRFRHVVSEATCGGAACPSGASEETTMCPRKCHEPVYCLWGEWRDWSECSATCGSAQKSRTRHLQLTAAPAPEQVVAASNEITMKFLEDDKFLEDSVIQMKSHTNGLQMRRVRELMLAFTCGGVSLVVGLAVFRSLSRVARRSSPTAEASWYNEGPL